MKIAYLSSQYPCLSMTFVLREVLHLRGLGWQVGVASINGVDRPPERLTEDERREAAATYYVKQHGVPGALRAHLQAAFKHPAGYLAGWRQALRLGGFSPRGLLMHLAYFTEALMVTTWMARGGYRHLHVHLGQQASTVGLYVKWVTGCGLSITIHGPIEFYNVEQHLLRQKVADADFIVCISHFARSQLMMLSPHAHWAKLLVCRLGVDPARFAARPVPVRVSGAPFQILCVGRLTPEKGQHLLLEAVARLKGLGLAVHLRLGGAGADDATLKALAARLDIVDAVAFLGGVNQDAIRAIYAQADCFCLPSFAEGIPVVLMEAMAMQIPCVTTHITGVPELIEHGEHGLLVPPADLDALVQALRSLVEQPQLCDRLARAGRARVLADYDLPRNVSVFAKLLGERVA